MNKPEVGFHVGEIVKGKGDFMLMIIRIHAYGCVVHSIVFI